MPTRRPAPEAAGGACAVSSAGPGRGSDLYRCQRQQDLRAQQSGEGTGASPTSIDTGGSD